MKFDYHVVDVFTTVPLEGNALAVFPDASGMDAVTMQRVARELNLSETTFVLPRESEGDATRVRIFTPAAELPFAGHPTIGTAYVMRRLGLVPAKARSFALARERRTSSDPSGRRRRSPPVANDTADSPARRNLPETGVRARFHSLRNGFSPAFTASCFRPAMR